MLAKVLAPIISTMAAMYAVMRRRVRSMANSNLSIDAQIVNLGHPYGIALMARP